MTDLDGSTRVVNCAKGARVVNRILPEGRLGEAGREAQVMARQGLAASEELFLRPGGMD
jgi:hypothetical protein